MNHSLNICECPAGFDDPYFIPDDSCACGTEKPHWHCGECNGLMHVD